MLASNRGYEISLYLPGGVEEVVAEFLTEAFQGPLLYLEAKTN